MNMNMYMHMQMYMYYCVTEQQLPLYKCTHHTESYTTHLCDDILELTLLPGLRRMSHHRQHCIVVFLVLVIEEDQLRPKVGLLSCTKYLKSG